MKLRISTACFSLTLSLVAPMPNWKENVSRQVNSKSIFSYIVCYFKRCPISLNKSLMERFLFFFRYSTVADPGFPIGGRAPIRWGVDLRHRHFSVKMYVKIKELARPPQIRQCSKTCFVRPLVLSTVNDNTRQVAVNYGRKRQVYCR